LSFNFSVNQEVLLLPTLKVLLSTILRVVTTTIIGDDRKVIEIITTLLLTYFNENNRIEVNSHFILTIILFCINHKISHFCFVLYFYEMMKNEKNKIKIYEN